MSEPKDTSRDGMHDDREPEDTSQEDADFAKKIGFANDADEASDADLGCPDEEDGSSLNEEVFDDSSGEGAEPPPDQGSSDATSPEMLETAIGVEDSEETDEDSELCEPSPSPTHASTTATSELERRAGLLAGRALAVPDEGTNWDIVQSRSAQILDLEAEIEQLRAQYENRTNEVQTGAVELADGVQDGPGISGLEKRVGELESELEAGEVEMAQLQQNLTNRESEVAGAHQRLRRLESAIDSTPIPRDQAQRDLATEVSGLRRALAESSREAAEREKERAEIKTELSLALASVEAQCRENRVGLDRIESLESALQVRDRELAELRDAHRVLINSNNRISLRCAEFEGNIEALEQTLAAREQEMTAKEEYISLTRQGLDERDDQLSLLSQQIDELSGKIALRDAELDSRRGEIEQVRQKAGQRETRIASLAKTIAVIERAITSNPATALLSDSTTTPQQQSDSNEPDEPSDEDIPLEAGAEDEGLEETEEEPPLEDTETTDCTSEPAPLADEVPAALDQADESPPVSDAELCQDTASKLESCIEPESIFASHPPARPPIHERWRDARADELLGHLELHTTDEFFAFQIIDVCAEDDPRTMHIWSLCGSDVQLEQRLALRLQDAGVDDFLFHCIESDPQRAEQRIADAESEGLAGKLACEDPTWASWPLESECDVILMDGSLRYSRDRDKTLDLVHEACQRGAVFLLYEQQGEACPDYSEASLEAIARVWEVMPERYRKNHVTQCDDEQFAGVASAANEPLQGHEDLLLLLQERFNFEILATFGNLIDVFIEAERAANFDADDDGDVQFIERFAEIDATRMREADLPPRHFLALLRTGEVASPIIVGSQSTLELA